LETFGYILETTLWHYGEVRLPGIGVLFLQLKTAQPNWKDQSIQAPYADIEFRPDFDEQINHCKRHANLHEIAEHIKSSLSKSNACYLSGFGHFYKTSAEDEIVFFAENGNTMQAWYSSLPMLTFQWIERTERVQTGASVNSILEVKKKNPRWLRLFFFLCIPIFAAIAFLWFLPINEELPPLPNGKVNLKPEYSISNEDTGISDYDINESYHSEEKVEFRDRPIEQTSNSDDVDIVEEADKLVPEKELKDKKAQVYNLSADVCHIILGSFKVEQNSVNYANRLEEMGIQTELIPFGEFTRVAIRTGCTESESAIQQIKSDLAPNAWLLSKKQ
jgi:hypothetical protein